MVSFRFFDVLPTTFITRIFFCSQRNKWSNNIHKITIIGRNSPFSHTDNSTTQSIIRRKVPIANKGSTVQYTYIIKMTKGGLSSVRRKVLLLLFTAVIAFLQAPTALAAFTKPPPPPKKDGEEKKDVSPYVAAAAATLPQKLPYFAGALALASTDAVVHKLVNETRLFSLKHNRGNYKETLLYGGTYMNLYFKSKRQSYQTTATTNSHLTTRI